MKRDMDLVRDLLLQLEAYDPQHGQDILQPPFDEPPFTGLKDYSPETIGVHLAWLYEAGLVAGESYPLREGFTFRRLSWNGCDFLDQVRDPEVWKRTKDGASKVGGLGFGLIKDMATAYAKHVAKERLGLDL